MKPDFFKRLRSATWKPAPNSDVGPAFCLGTLNAGSSPKDTFLNLTNWDYGFVFKGRNLGRYWNIGPQETLYLPGAWLHPEDNEASHHHSCFTSLMNIQICLHPQNVFLILY
ncbi:Beta-galactosidase-1-like protein 3 [Manis javanica]|nr:Beta-galactosidase-1-like protein 3 [Manis javanica]